jgi:hypothetical protein
MLIWLLAVSAALAGASQEAVELQREVETILGTPVVVTGAERSPKRQAQLIYAKLKRGQDLFKLYANSDIIKSILRNKDLYSIETMIKAHMRKGNYLSSHLCGKAIDIRSRTMSKDMRLQVLEKLNSTPGLQAIYEPSPPHIHIERTEGCG